MEYYSAISITKRMILRCIMLSKINQKQSYLFYDSIYMPFWKRQRWGQKTDQWLTEAEAEETVLVQNDTIKFWGMVEVLIFYCGYSYTNVYLCQNSWILPFVSNTSINILFKKNKMESVFHFQNFLKWEI